LGGKRSCGYSSAQCRLRKFERLIDQYQVSTDKRSGITNDPNRPDDPQYIVRLIAQVITVSLETVRIVKNLPPLQTPSI
jgi:predicted helicase